VCCLVGMVCSVTFVVCSLLCLGGRYHFVPGLVLFLIFGVCHTWSMTYMWVKTCIVALTTDPKAKLSVKEYPRSFWACMAWGIFSWFLFFMGKPWFGEAGKWSAECTAAWVVTCFAYAQHCSPRK
jgi:hypothetical protein